MLFLFNNFKYHRIWFDYRTCEMKVNSKRIHERFCDFLTVLSIAPFAGTNIHINYYDLRRWSSLQQLFQCVCAVMSCPVFLCVHSIYPTIRTSYYIVNSLFYHYIKEGKNQVITPRTKFHMRSSHLAFSFLVTIFFCNCFALWLCIKCTVRLSHSINVEITYTFHITYTIYLLYIFHAIVSKPD